MKKLIFGAIMAACAGPAFADNCDAPDLNGFDRIYCLRKIYFGHDARLNENYQTLRGFLSGGDRKTLLTAQRNWIAKRNNLCMVDADTVNVRCALNTTRDRADFLQERIVECQTTGCHRSKLTLY